MSGVRIEVLVIAPGGAGTMRTLSYVLAALAAAVLASWLIWGDLVTRPKLAPVGAAPTLRQRQFGLDVTPAFARALEARLPDDARSDDGLEKTVRRIAERAGLE